MGNIIGQQTTIDFTKCVKSPKSIPFIAKVYIGFLHKILNISPHVGLGSIVLSMGFNVFHIKEMEKRKKPSHP
jgi:hypothetical protein